MTMKLLTTVCLAAGAILAAGSASAEVPKAKWVAQCEGALSKEHKPRIKKVYCTCMHEGVGDISDKYEYALEREFPPVHLTCYKKAGFRPPV
jgi:hypothetical protein